MLWVGQLKADEISVWKEGKTFSPWHEQALVSQYGMLQILKSWMAETTSKAREIPLVNTVSKGMHAVDSRMQFSADIYPNHDWASHATSFVAGASSTASFVRSYGWSRAGS